jgi:hypothetical protein
MDDDSSDGGESKEADFEREIPSKMRNLYDPSRASLLMELLDAALLDVLQYASEAERDAAAIEHKWQDAADGFVRKAELVAPLLDREFQSSVRRIMRAVVDAFELRSTADVVWLAQNLDKRKRRQWLRYCEEALRGCPSVVDKRLHEELIENGLQLLVPQLNSLNAGGEQVTPEMISVARKHTTTVEGFAARLACDSGGFGYGVDYQGARDAFRKLR